MKKLRILIVRNTIFSPEPIYLPNQLKLLDWKGYPSKSFPPSFYLKKIAAFNLRCSHLVLEKPFQKFEHLIYMNFSYCHSITQFPDVSGAQNLRELILDKCEKLVEVDKSVGFLPNLVYLSASGCIQLSSFLSKICLPSLEYLSLDLCTRLEHFPDVEGKMDKPLNISMKHTAIKELPHSFADLGGLGYLDMTSCKKLQNLPGSLFMLPNFDTLKIGGCPQLRESLTSFKGSHSIAECRPSLKTLHFGNACLSEENLDVILQSFPNLIDLNVSSNYTVSLPACIKESICLASLDVSYCMKLQEISELPSSVKKLDARHCNSLAADISSVLWSQVRKEKNRLEIVMPKSDIPTWWDYCGEGGIPIFWVRSKFPIVALSFVLDKIKYQAVALHLFIDGEHVNVQRQPYRNFTAAEDHVLLCDLRVLFSDEEWERLDARVGHDNDWKRVQVKCETDIILGQWGVYVYKKETNINDIQFTCPESLGIRSLPAMNAIPITSDEVEIKSATTSSSHVEDSASTIKVEEASCLAHAEVDDDSNPHTRNCSRCCSTMLSTFTRNCSRCCSILPTFKKLLCCQAEDTKYGEARMTKAQPARLPGLHYGDGDNVDVEKQMAPDFSESLQTVVENLKRVVVPRQDDYNSEWLTERKILSDDDYEDEEEEEEGQSDTEA